MNAAQPQSEPTVFDQGSERERGLAQGEMWRSQIVEVAAIRRAWCRSTGAFGDEDAVSGAAECYWNYVAETEPGVAAELQGIADGAGISRADVVVINAARELWNWQAHANGRRGPAAVHDGGRVTIYLWGRDGAVVGQRLCVPRDIAPFMRTVWLNPPDGDGSMLCLTVAGGLAIAGVGRSGLAVVANELTTANPRLGLISSAVIRLMLAQRDVRAAQRLLMVTQTAGAHHYMLADGRAFAGVESGACEKIVTQLGPKVAHIHTDHFFDPVLRREEVPPVENHTFTRMNAVTTAYVQARPSDIEGLWQLLGAGHSETGLGHDDEACADLLEVAFTVLLEPLAATMRWGKSDDALGDLFPCVLPV